MEVYSPLNPLPRFDLPGTREVFRLLSPKKTLVVEGTTADDEWRIGQVEMTEPHAHFLGFIWACVTPVSV